MVTQEAIKQNYKKVLAIKDKWLIVEHLHESAMYTYLVDGEEKHLPPEDIDAIIEDYKVKKQEVQNMFKELL